MHSTLKRITALLLSLIFAGAALCAFPGCGGSEAEIDASVQDTPEATASPTPEPTEQATEAPTEAPTPTPAPTPEPTEEPTPAPTDTPRPTPESTMPYMLYLEKGSFTLTIYKRDQEGYYTEEVASYRVSHGGVKTPAGTYVLYIRQRWHPFANGDNGYAQYAVMYNPVSKPKGWSGLFLHGPMYRSEDPNDLWPRYYDGTKAIGGENTQGCIRMVVEASKFIYENCASGTLLKIVNGSPKGTTSAEVPDRHRLMHDPTDTEAKDKP